ncbi:SpoIIE family protein phosphatase [Oerskovia sp. M15]
MVGELRSVADALQDAMLPDEPTAPGWHTRYRPADDSLLIGGDWYDVVDLSGAVRPGRRRLRGQGLRAAAVMGQLRSASRALLLENHGPAATLEGLDRFARTLPGAELATVLCAIVDENARTLTYSAAGHLPPLVVSTAETRWLNEGRGTPSPSSTAPREPPRRSRAVTRSSSTPTGSSSGAASTCPKGCAVSPARPSRSVRTTRGRSARRAARRAPRGGARDDVALLVYEVP